MFFFFLLYPPCSRILALLLSLSLPFFFSSVTQMAKSSRTFRLHSTFLLLHPQSLALPCHPQDVITSRSYIFIIFILPRSIVYIDSFNSFMHGHTHTHTQILKTISSHSLFLSKSHPHIPDAVLWCTDLS